MKKKNSFSKAPNLFFFFFFLQMRPNGNSGRIKETWPCIIIYKNRWMEPVSCSAGQAGLAANEIGDYLTDHWIGHCSDSLTSSVSVQDGIERTDQGLRGRIITRDAGPPPRTRCFYGIRKSREKKKYRHIMNVFPHYSASNSRKNTHTHNSKLHQLCRCN